MVGSSRLDLCPALLFYLGKRRAELSSDVHKYVRLQEH